LYFGSDFIAQSWLGDVRTVHSIQLLAVSLPFLVMCSILHGYFTAVRRTYKSAVSLIFEQFTRITVTALALTLFFATDVESACLCVVAGGVIAEIISFLFCYILYRIDRRKLTRKANRPAKLNRRIFSIAIPVALSSYVRSGLLTVEHLLIPKGLLKYGYNSAQALAAYGVISGMVFPVIMFPSALLFPFGDLLIPELAGYFSSGAREKISRLTRKVFHITLIFSVGISTILWVCAEDLGQLLYSNADAAFYIKVLSPLVTVMYLDHLADGILKGIDQQNSVMAYNLLDSSLSVILVLTLVPAIGINGYVITIYITDFVIFSRSLRAVNI
jgi:stage V sporulation protein B